MQRLSLLLLLPILCFVSCDYFVSPLKTDDDFTIGETTLMPQDDGYINNTPSTEFNAQTMGVTGGTAVSLLRFSLGDIPDNSTIMTARLYVKCESCGASGELYCHPIILNWDSVSINWATAESTSFYNSFNSVFRGKVESPAENGRLFSWNLQNILQRWVSGYPNHGILIKGDSNAPASIYFYTSESSYSPELYIRYKVYE